MVKKALTSSILLLTLLSAIFTLPALGASDSATTTVSWSVLPFARLSIAGGRESGETVSTTYGLPQPSAADLERGYLEREGALTLIAESNTDWQVVVRTDDPNLGQSYDGTYVKPLDDFQLRAAGGEYRSLSNRAKALTAGTNGRYELGIDYRILFDRERYRPGDYQVTLTYTIVTD